MSRNKRSKPGGGKYNRGKGKGRGGKSGGGQQRNFPDNRTSFELIDKQNAQFEKFYNSLELVPPGAEQDAFWSALRKELPNSFRFTGSRGHALGVRDNLVNRFFPLIEKIEHEGRPVEPPKQMPWYPDGLAYSMTTPKNVIRKYEPFKEFQRFLVSETGVGNISRQEEVSMIPPLLLDVEPHHAVLDLCAAPGSKSAQLIELIHAGEEDRVGRAIKRARGEGSTAGDQDNGNSEDGGRPTGMLIANDANYRRAHMLIHQVKRLNSPNLIVMNHDATMFPSIELPTVTEPGQVKRGKYLKFDRILADVPCSGDGTCRKNPSIWKEWQPQNGLGLYITQVRILVRALQMLKVGGRVVYSTCSLNPVENEAVVAAAIERCGGVSKVKLVDCSDRLPGLLRYPGRKDWSIMNRQGQVFESWAEAEQYEQDGSRIVPGMFAPEPEEDIPLEHCIRVYPHQQDTGGFFIAKLEKLSEIKAKPEGESKSGSKKWVFSQPELPTTTAFTDLLSEAAHGSGDSPAKNPDLSNGDVTAAQRQNSFEENVGVKRAAPGDEADGDASKRLKTDYETERRGHRPLPPAVAMAVDAVGAETGTETTNNGASDEGDVDAPTEVADAVDDAPFEKTVSAETSQQTGPKRRRGDDAANEESFKYIDPSHPDLLTIYDFYELHPNFPRNRFLVRNPAGDPVKGIYYTSELVKDVLTTNETRGMKFVHAGVKMFQKQDSQGQDICRWRIQTEGLAIIDGWVGEPRVIKLWKKSTLRKLLIEMFPKIATTKSDDGTETGGWKDLGEIGEVVQDLGMGCCLLRVQAIPDAGEDEFQEGLTLPLWRSLHSLNLMLPKEDRRAMLLRIYNEDVNLINHSDTKHGGPSAGAKGSESAEADADELQKKFAEAEDDGGEDDDVMDTDAAAELGAPDENGRPNVDLDAVAMEHDAIAAQDRIQSKRLEVLEDENRKIAEAMPERAGEGDDYNTTV